MPGYCHHLYILPFDHRSSFARVFLGNFKKLDKKQIKLIKSYKQIIFDAFLLAIKHIIPADDCAIMIDDVFGADIIKSAQKKNITVCLPVEKSGQQQFSFEHGKNFDKYILNFQPQIVKALVRYNPNKDNKKNNLIQLKRLKKLNDWCRAKNYKFMLELLVPSTESNLKRARGKRENYDLRIRPQLTSRAISEFSQAAIWPDIWKIEAYEKQEDWQEIIDLIRDDGRDEVAIIMLGRGESFAKVKSWMNIAPKHLLNGFAVGRTVFLRPLLDFHQKKIGKKQTIWQIAKNYLELIRYWEK